MSEINYIYEKLGSVDLIQKHLNDGSHAILVTSQSGEIVFVNEKYCTLTGYAEHELIGENPRILKSGYQSSEFYKKMYNKLGENGKFEGRLKNKKKNGQNYWIYSHINTLVSENNEVRGYLAIVEDITNFIDLENKSILSQEVLSGILKNIPKTGILLVQPGSKEVFLAEGEIVNEFFLEDTVQIDQVEELFLEFKLDLKSELKCLLNSGETFRKKVSYNIRTLDITFSLYRVGKSINADYCGIIIRDISDYQDIIDKVKLNEQQLNAIFQNASIGIGIIDVWGNYKRVNEAWSRMTGFSKESLMEMNIKDMIHPRDLEIYHPELKKLAKGSKINHRLVVRVKKDDDSIIYCDVSMSVIMNNQRDVESIIAVASDITQERKAKEALERSEMKLKDLNATKDRFFSILAHDLKNPFNAILGLSDLALDEDFDISKDKLLEYMAKINQTANQTFSLLENLLEWARMQSGKLKAYPISVALKPIVDENVELTESMAENKHILVDNKVSEASIGYFDPLMIKTVVRNLITNAIKFSHPGSKIVIGSNDDDEELSFYIQDSGVGMSPQQVSDLFDIQKTSTGKGTQGEKGTGIGLLLVNDFIRLNNGTISIDSEPGKGTTFFITLPLPS